MIDLRNILKLTFFSNISALLEKAIKRGQKDKTGLGYNSEKSVNS